MQKKSTLLIGGICIFLIVLGAWWLNRRYFQLGAQTLQPGKPVVVSEPTVDYVTPIAVSDSTSTNAPPSSANPTNTSVPFKLEPFVTNLKVPWSFVFTSPNRILVTERPGRVRVIENGQLLPTPIRTFPEVSHQAEEGLMGMVLDPNYATNHYLYLCVAYVNQGKTVDKVVRVTDRAKTLDEDYVVIDQLPAAQFHAGCRLRFGPDEKLYISTGDATNKKLPQDLQSLGGKILRLNADGTIPTDNPFPNSPIYSYGHRNPQGFDWHPVTGALIETEHGPSGNDGPGGGDEVNFIQKGQNYGWPTVSHEKTQAGLVSPLLVFTPAVAPASGMFYRGSVFPQFTNTFLFGMLRGQGILQVVFDANSAQAGKIISYQKLAGIEVGRVRDIVEGPDGYIYFTTSNQDGRGKPQSNDDLIYRMVPAK